MPAVPLVGRSRTAAIFESAGLSTTSTTFQLAELPCGGSRSLFPVALPGVVSHSVVSSTRKPERPAAATRKPRRAPRFVPSRR